MIVLVDEATPPCSSRRARPLARAGSRARRVAVLVLATFAVVAPLGTPASHAFAKGAPAKPPAGKPRPAPPPAPAPTTAPASTPWWDAAWSHRRVLTLAASGPLAAHTGSATFSTHGALRADASDLRVVGPDGAPVGVELLEAGPGDVVSFLFEAKEPTARYVAYWGCAAPKAPSPAWTRDGGLVCEVRRWDAPFPVNAASDAEFALRVAKDVEGRVQRLKIFDGLNPAGPSASYVAVYRGFFRVGETADYELCTASSHASILRVETAEVALWSRSGGPWSAQRGEFRTARAPRRGRASDRVPPLRGRRRAAGGRRRDPQGGRDAVARALGRRLRPRRPGRGGPRRDRDGTSSRRLRLEHRPALRRAAAVPSCGCASRPRARRSGRRARGSSGTGAPARARRSTTCSSDPARAPCA